jgi:hypothetical protein
MTHTNSTQLSGEVSPAYFEVAFEKIKNAIAELCTKAGPIPPKGHWTLTSESTREEVLSYLLNYGLSHLRELIFALSRDPKFANAREFDVVVDLNGAAGQCAILLMMLGFTKRAIVIDRSGAAAEVALDLARICNCDLVFLDVTEIYEHSGNTMKVDSLLLLANHALNCWSMPFREFDTETLALEQLSLDFQNQEVLELMAAITNPKELIAISLEPQFSSHKGLRQLLSPWENTHDWKGAFFKIDGFEFEFYGEAKKRYQSSELVGPLVAFNEDLQTPASYSTPFGMHFVEYIPPVVKIMQAEVADLSGLFITVADHESLLKAHLEFRKKCKNSQRDENLLLFGEEWPDTIWDAEDEIAALLGFELEVTL